MISRPLCGHFPESGVDPIVVPLSLLHKKKSDSIVAQSYCKIKLVAIFRVSTN